MGNILSAIGRAFSSVIPETGNQFLDGMLVTALLGALSFVLRGVPRAIGRLIVRYFTTEMMLTSAHISFHEVMSWTAIMGYSSRFRRVEVRNSRGGQRSTKGVGNGVHWFMHPSHGNVFKRTIFMFNLEKVDMTFSETEKERLRIRVFGRSHKPLDRLIEESQVAFKTQDGNMVYKYSNFWMSLGSHPGRTLDSVIIPVETRDLIVNRINRYRSQEKWCVERGIPWHLGIMLYGPPGTGKTSLANAIASYLEYGISILPANKTFYIDEALAGADKESIILIEDVHTIWRPEDREEIVSSMTPEPGGVIEPSPKTRSLHRKKEDLLSQFVEAGLSNVLNALDGIGSTHGRIVIMTANDISGMDPALLRAGRIDLCVEIGYLNSECLGEMLERFFPGCSFPGDYVVQANLMPATVQEKVMKGDSFDEIVEACRKKQQ